jgi:hypothetical protein
MGGRKANTSRHNAGRLPAPKFLVVNVLHLSQGHYAMNHLNLVCRYSNLFFANDQSGQQGHLSPSGSAARQQLIQVP